MHAFTSIQDPLGNTTEESIFKIHLTLLKPFEHVFDYSRRACMHWYKFFVTCTSLLHLIRALYLCALLIPIIVATIQLIWIFSQTTIFLISCHSSLIWHPAVRINSNNWSLLSPQYFSDVMELLLSHIFFQSIRWLFHHR